jgi:hypothetical protein
VNVRNGRKEAYSTLRIAMQKAAQLRLAEKEKNKSPSCAMRVSTRINKIVWSMLADGKSFAEAEINDLVNLISFQPNVVLSAISDSTRSNMFRMCLRMMIISSCRKLTLHERMCLDLALIFQLIYRFLISTGTTKILASHS